MALFGDEGAANHNRLGGDYAKRGVQVFVYGQQYLNNGLRDQNVILHVRHVKRARPLHVCIV